MEEGEGISMSPEEKAMLKRELKDVYNRASQGVHLHADYKTITKILLKVLNEVKVTE
jgi:hypothetical protein